jgi:hypothetical protein
MRNAAARVRVSPRGPGLYYTEYLCGVRVFVWRPELEQSPAADRIIDNDFDWTGGLDLS